MKKEKGICKESKGALRKRLKKEKKGKEKLIKQFNSIGNSGIDLITQNEKLLARVQQMDAKMRDMSETMAELLTLLNKYDTNIEMLTHDVEKLVNRIDSRSTCCKMTVDDEDEDDDVNENKFAYGKKFPREDYDEDDEDDDLDRDSVYPDSVYKNDIASSTDEEDISDKKVQTLKLHPDTVEETSGSIDVGDYMKLINKLYYIDTRLYSATIRETNGIIMLYEDRNDEMIEVLKGLGMNTYFIRSSDNDHDTPVYLEKVGQVYSYGLFFTYADDVLTKNRYKHSNPDICRLYCNGKGKNFELGDVIKSGGITKSTEKRIELLQALVNLKRETGCLPAK